MVTPRVRSNIFQSWHADSAKGLKTGASMAERPRMFLPYIVGAERKKEIADLNLIHVRHGGHGWDFNPVANTSIMYNW
jgi:hypothetical protein